MTDWADSKDGLVLLTPVELAGRWRMSARTLERWRTDRIGPPWLRLNCRVLYRRADVLAYERARLERPEP